MKFFSIIFISILFSHYLTAQDVSLPELYEIADCGKSCYDDIMKKYSFVRLDDSEGSDFTRNDIGKYMRYGSNDESSKVRSIVFFVGSGRQTAILYTDDKEYWGQFYEQIKATNKYRRLRNKEGSTKYDDWVYQPINNPSYSLTFINQNGHKMGNYSLSVAYRD